MVTDYYSAFDGAIARGFTEARNLVLTRHPLPLCEGLMRSGLSEGRAISGSGGRKDPVLTSNQLGRGG